MFSFFSVSITPVNRLRRMASGGLRVLGMLSFLQNSPPERDLPPNGVEMGGHCWQDGGSKDFIGARN